MNSQTWEFWVDVGGTFTDCFARRPDVALRRHKLLSSAVTKGAAGAGSGNGHVVDPARIADPSGFWTGWSIALLDSAGQPIAQSRVNEFDSRRGVLILENPQLTVSLGQRYELLPDEPAPVVAIRYLLGLRRIDSIPPLKLKLGTTRATNALITRSGARTALVTTRGFADVLTIGNQYRPQLFDLTIRKPPPLVCCSVEINERISADGEVLLSPAAEQIDEQLAQLKQQGIESIAVCLLHAVANPTHELLVGQLARRHGISEVSLSHQAAPLVKFVSRGDTTTANAYLNPVLRGYLEDLSSRLPGSDIKVLTSAGGLIGAASLHAKDAVLSGPAGGVVGFSRVARAAGFSRSIGFDMGGTSTDVSRFDGRFEREFETEKAGVRLVTPMMAIETVAAGGGSICRFDGAKLVVGPQSAGADPGPACYGRGGPLTITDCNYFLGRVPAARFPFPLDLTAVQRRLQAVANEVESSSGQRYELSKLADGFIRVANATMARAIRSVSTAKGYDVRDYPLVSFGGAGGQHACAIARELGIRQVLCPPDAGLLSAYGIGLADIVRHQVAGIYQRLTPQSRREAAATFTSLSNAALQQVLAEGVPLDRIAIQRTLQLRYEGVEASLPIDEPATGDYAQAFINEHRRLFGYVHDQRPIEIVSALVEVTGQVAAALPESLAIDPKPRSTTMTTPAFVDGEAAEIQLIDASDLAPGDRFTGPAIIAASTSTVLVDPLWQANVLSQGDLLLTDTAPPATQAATTASDPVTLEIFNHLFAGIADQMGYTLRATSTSVNVKERLDYSCAIFDAAGQLIATAAHIPVHLGAMGLTVRAVISECSAINPGDVFITNDPYRGGSHLPDVTVITPIHGAAGQLLFFTASRAHHAEIGGIAPGSMPPSSKNLAEEGVLIGLMKLVDAGSARFDDLETLLKSAPYPSRDAQTNLADITAQVAANARGAAELLSLVDRYTLPVVQAQMHHIRIAAQQKIRRALAKIDNGVYRRIEYLDDGSPIAVTFTVSYDTATVDFTGTAPEQPNNFNANRAIVTAAVLYVLRCLIADDVPLNEGMLAPVDIILPECMLNPGRRPAPGDCAAVAAGNVETSQRIVDALLGALGLAAASQGTMNNLLFGDATFGYYETICGGSGATVAGPGADAVHTHMTNTRLTDVEVLERRYPVRVHEFAIRKGSGGSGQNPGGDGVLRELEFLRPLELSIISQRRGEYPPYGIAGGQPGAIGRNTLIRADGSTLDLGGISHITVATGDRLRIETPGGGGWGTPRQSNFDP